MAVSGGGSVGIVILIFFMYVNARDLLIWLRLGLMLGSGLGQKFLICAYGISKLQIDKSRATCIR